MVPSASMYYNHLSMPVSYKRDWNLIVGPKSFYRVYCVVQNLPWEEPIEHLAFGSDKSNRIHTIDLCSSEDVDLPTGATGAGLLYAM